MDFGFRRGALHPLSPGILAQGIQSRPDVQYRRRNVEAPRLLNAEERTRLRELVAAREPRNSPFIVISPSPIFGFPPLEWLQEESGRVVPDVADLESWGANPRNLIDAMELFASHRPDPLLILSGDVHYGFEVVGRIHKTNGSVPFVQLCSSAFKNKAVQREAQSLKLLSRFSNKDRSVAYWDLRQADQDDGALAWMDVKRPSVDVFSALFGIPAMILETQFVRRSGRLDVHERIEMENNLGDLVIRGGRVSHRHWVAANGGRLIAREWSDWRTSNWPVADPLTSLINAIVGAP